MYWDLGISVAQSLRNITNLGIGKSWIPLFLQDVKANAPITVYVRVEHLGPKRHLQSKFLCHYNRTSTLSRDDGEHTIMQVTPRQQTKLKHEQHQAYPRSFALFVLHVKHALETRGQGTEEPYGTLGGLKG